MKKKIRRKYVLGLRLVVFRTNDDWEENSKENEVYTWTQPSLLSEDMWDKIAGWAEEGLAHREKIRIERIDKLKSICAPTSIMQYELNILREIRINLAAPEGGSRTRTNEVLLMKTKTLDTNQYSVILSPQQHIIGQ